MAFTNQDKRDYIYEIQSYLRGISFINPTIPAIIPDGIYGEDSRKAVRTFQKEYGLPETGAVDKDTFDKIVTVYNTDVTSYFLGPNKIKVFPSSDYKINYMEKGDYIYILQAMINTISQYYSNINTITVNGVYDTETMDEVKKLQVIVGNPPTGIIDLESWNDIANLYNIHAGK